MKTKSKAKTPSTAPASARTKNTPTTLTSLFRQKFSSKTEHRPLIAQLENISGGIPADFEPDDPKTITAKPKNPKEKWVYSEAIQWLLTNKEALECITHKGLTIKNAIIKNELDLEGLSFSYLLGFENCLFEGGISLDRAQMATLSLSNSIVQGQVKMVGARFQGQLNFQKARLENKDGHSLVIQYSRIEGCVFLDEEFQACSEVNLQGTTIMGSLFCGASTFDNPNGWAINAKRIRVNGDVLLNAERVRSGKMKPFIARGEVKFCGAQIGGQFKCRGGSFNAPANAEEISDYTQPQCAIIAKGIKVMGPVLLDRGFCAEGEVNLVSAFIQGNFDCSGGFFKHEAKKALCVKGIKVEGDVLLSNNEYTSKENKQCFRAIGEVVLSGATIEGSLRCNGGIFHNTVACGGEAFALQAEGVYVKESVILDNSFNAKGIVNFLNARIDQSFVLGTVIKNQDYRLKLTNAVADTVMVDEKGWPEEGKLWINDLNYNSFLCNSEKQDKGISWLKLNALQFSPQPYRQLAQVLDNKGHEIEARDILVSMNDQLRKKAQQRKQRIWLRISGWLIGYGYKPFKVWKPALFIWLLGAFFFMLGNEASVMQPYSKFAHKEYDNRIELYEYHPNFCALVYSLDVFLPIVNLHQEEHWRPTPEPPLGYEQNLVNTYIINPARKVTGNFLIGWMYIQILAGWFLTTMLVGGLTGLVRAK